MQEERTSQLKKFLIENPLAGKILKIDKNSKFIPIVVTLFEEDLIKENETIFVPAYKLNSFLQDIRLYI